MVYNEAMNFIEIAVLNIDGESAEAVAELFNRYGHGGAVMDAYPPHYDRVTVRTVLPEDDPDRLNKMTVMLMLMGQLLPQGLPEPQLSNIGENDWAESWKEHFHPIRIGKHFVIKFTWRDYQPAAEDVMIEIDPGLAFGSGLHPTTQLCLELLENMSLTDQSVFDVGTGSGILAMAAWKLGARPILAVDNDDVAVRVAQENFTLNGVTAETAVGSANDNMGQTWQIVIANIIAPVLTEILPDLVAAVTEGGQLILSGMLAEQEADMRAQVEALQLTVTNRHQIDDWVALVIAK